MVYIKLNLITTRKKYIHENNLYLNSLVQNYTFIFKKPVINFYNNIYHQFLIKSKTHKSSLFSFI